MHLWCAAVFLWKGTGHGQAADRAHGGGPETAVVALSDVGVRRHTSGREILSEIDWTVRAGEHWALLGANGAGKTTLLRLLGAAPHPTSGSVEVLGCRLGRVDVRELRARIGHVSTAQHVPPDADVYTVVLTGHSGTVQPLWRTYDEVRERARDLLAEFEIKDLADRPWRTMTRTLPDTSAHDDFAAVVIRTPTVVIRTPTVTNRRGRQSKRRSRRPHSTVSRSRGSSRPFQGATVDEVLAVINADETLNEQCSVVGGAVSRGLAMKRGTQASHRIRNLLGDHLAAEEAVLKPST